MATTLYSQDFTGLTPPVLPANIDVTGIWATTNVQGFTTVPSVVMTEKDVVRQINPNTGTAGVRVVTNPDSIRYSVAVRFGPRDGGSAWSWLQIGFSSSTNSAQQFVILQNGYLVSPPWGPGLRFGNTGTTTLPAIGNSSTFTYDQWYKVTVERVGTTFRCEVRRRDDGMYLSSSGTWQSTQVYCYENEVDEAGLDRPFSIVQASSGDGNIFVDNLQVEDLGPAAADSFTLTAPSPARCKEGTPSGNFTLAANGSSNVVVTLSDGSENGTFAPSSPSLDDTNPVTFTYTPEVTGTRRTITISASAVGLTAPGTVTIEAWVEQVATVTPGGPLDLATNEQQQFAAAVTGGPTGESAAGSWSIIGSGSITSGGLYTAPLSGSGTDTIRFTHTASGVYDEVTVNYAPGIAVQVDPASAAISPSATREFTATVTGATDESVTWSVVEVGGGAVTSGGLYTAPAGEGTYHVRATSVEDPSKYGQAIVTVAVPPPPPPPLPDARIIVPHLRTGIDNLYAVGFNLGTEFLKGDVVEEYNAANWSEYAIPLFEIGSTGVYAADLPEGVRSGSSYLFLVFSGAALAPTDEYRGSIQLTLS